jgi:hypothetical protein
MWHRWIGQGGLVSLPVQMKAGEQRLFAYRTPKSCLSHVLLTQSQLRRQKQGHNR